MEAERDRWRQNEKRGDRERQRETERDNEIERETEKQKRVYLREQRRRQRGSRRDAEGGHFCFNKRGKIHKMGNSKR